MLFYNVKSKVYQVRHIMRDTNKIQTCWCDQNKDEYTNEGSLSFTFNIFTNLEIKKIGNFTSFFSKLISVFSQPHQICKLSQRFIVL
jgi:hypothetical protein